MVKDSGMLPLGYEESARALESYARGAGEAYRELLSSGALTNLAAAAEQATVIQGLISGSSPVTSLLKEAAEQGERMRRLLEPYRSSAEVLNQQIRSATRALKSIDSTWQFPLGLKQAARDKSGVAAAIELATQSLTKGFDAAILTQFERARISAASGMIRPAEWDRLLGGLDGMAAAQEALLKQVGGQPFGALEVPRLLVEWPPLEMVSHAHLARVLALSPAEVDRPHSKEGPHDHQLVLDEDANRELMEVLAEHPELKGEWVSAQAILRSQDARLKQRRYFCLSIRELLKRVLDRVAPLAVVGPWAETAGLKQQKSMYSRLLYVASIYPSDSFAAYVVKDSDEMFATWDFVASGVHGDAQPSVDFLRALEWRAALWMLGVLKMAKERMN